jgi:hypothetical protein
VSRAQYARSAKLSKRLGQDSAEQVSEVLAALNFEELWDEASVSEERILIEDLVDSVNIFGPTDGPDRWRTTDSRHISRGRVEPGLQTCESEARLHGNATSHWRLD